MYRKNEQPATTPEKFELPFEGKLDAQNRWVIMAELIPWAEFEAEYASIFAEEIGAPAKSFRIAYSNEAPFEASMLVHFRERIGLELINKINRQMVKNQRESQGEENPGKKLEEEAKNPRENRGKLILDASCAPGDISYPTDLNLLNQARKQTEKIIDLLYEGLKGNLKKKPRTYRILARKSYLEVARRKRPTSKQRQKAIKKQLQYLSRNLAHIDQLLSEGGDLKTLKKRDYK
jgi:hypothetical protein